MLPQIGQQNVVYHGKVGVNKAEKTVQNVHLQQQKLLALRLGRLLLINSLGPHAEDEVNVPDTPPSVLW